MRIDDYRIDPITEQKVLEVSMAPGRLQKWADKHGENVLVGFEFELLIPGFTSSDDAEPDYSEDEFVDDLADIKRFFMDDDLGIGFIPSALLAKLEDQYEDYIEEKLIEFIKNESAEYERRMVDYFKETFMDQNDIDDSWEKASEKAEKQWKKEKHNRPGPSEEYIENIQNNIIKDMMKDAIKDSDVMKSDIKDAAYDEMRDYFHNHADLPDQGEFLKDKYKIESMSDFHKTFENLDVRWPFLKTDFEEDLFELANDLSNTIGAEVESSSTYHGAEHTRYSDKWAIETDDSIDIEDDYSAAGLEIISPPIPLHDAAKKAREFKQWALSKEAATNRTTGLHINMSLTDVDMSDVDFVKLALFMGDRYVLQKFDRLNNSYAASALDNLEKAASAKTPEELEGLMLELKRTIDKKTGEIVHSGETGKHTSINVQNGWIEFRGPGGNWLEQDIEEIILVMMRMGMALQIAADPNLYKKEYAKKFYKLMNTTNKADSSIIELFARYSSGTLSKEQIIAFLKEKKRQKEFDRRKELGDGPFYWAVKANGFDDLASTPLPMEMVTAHTEEEAIDKWFERNPNYKQNRQSIEFETQTA